MGLIKRLLGRQPKTTRRVFNTPVLVVDALGFAQKILQSDEEGLAKLSEDLDKHYLRLRQSLPYRCVIDTTNRVYGTDDFSTFRLNDMFVVYSCVDDSLNHLRYLIAASLCFQSLLIEGFIPRGGLGFGTVHACRTSLIGPGFLDAYYASEQRDGLIRDICGIQISPAFLKQLPKTRHFKNLICRYGDSYFVHPFGFTDPLLGEFSPDRIIELLAKAGVNEAKKRATRQFLSAFKGC